MDRSEKIILFVFTGVIGVVLCLVVALGGILLLGQRLSTPAVTPTAFTPTEVLPTQTPVMQLTPQAANTLFTDSPVLAGAEITLEALKQTEIPATDLVTIAEKFKGKSNIALSLTTPPVNYQVGDELYFWSLNVDSGVYTHIPTHLAYKTDRVYFWVADGVSYDENALQALVETFSNNIYPTDQEFFGKEWIPGVDNDPHLYILYAADLGSSVAGYTSGTDEVLTEAHPYANEHEMFAINASVQTLSDPYTYAVAAHELQHLIHNYHDSNEESWLNEGFSELAVFLNGYQTGGFDSVFSYNPDIQLNEWPNNPSLVEAHYGAGFLFTSYLLDQFGEDITKAVVADKANGLASIDDVFSTKEVQDDLTGKPMSADQLFQDWTLANYLQDSTISDGRFTYRDLTDPPVFTDTEVVPSCENVSLQRTVHQYGTDYIHLYCSGNYQLDFSGDATVQVIPVDSQQGEYFIWSNKADSSDMTMTRQFDFSLVTGEIKLNYDMWYDLETDYDFLYLLASEDGENWQILHSPSCTAYNVTGNNYGCAYNGKTPAWKNETVDLSDFAGKKVWLRFEYVTDAAVTGEGFAIDNISLSQIDYSTDFERDTGGWDLAGFVRMNNRIPQTFLVSTIQKLEGKTVVNQYQLAAGESLQLAPLDNENYFSDLVLVISASARYSRQEADYKVQIKPK